MGGPGSTRWRGHQKARLVEQAYRLDVRQLIAIGVIGPDSWTDQLLTWDEDGAAVLLQVRVHDRDGGVGIIHHTGPDDREVRNHVWLHFPPGDRPCWFRCPGLGEEECDARVRVLYLPPGEQRFACRRCHGLTYRSRQQHKMGDPTERAIGHLRREIVRGIRALRRTGDANDLDSLLAPLDPIDRKIVVACLGGASAVATAAACPARKAERKKGRCDSSARLRS